MTEKLSDGKKERDNLKIKRNKLFKQFLKHPCNIRLALVIKVIDDQLAQRSEQTLPKCTVGRLNRY